MLWYNFDGFPIKTEYNRFNKELSYGPQHQENADLDLFVPTFLHLFAMFTSCAISERNINSYLECVPWFY